MSEIKKSAKNAFFDKKHYDAPKGNTGSVFTFLSDPSQVDTDNDPNVPTPVRTKACRVLSYSLTRSTSIIYTNNT